MLSWNGSLSSRYVSKKARGRSLLLQSHSKFVGWMIHLSISGLFFVCGMLLKQVPVFQHNSVKIVACRKSLGTISIFDTGSTRKAREKGA